MAVIKGKALTDKGVVKTAVRGHIAEREVKAFDTNQMKGFERVGEKNIFTKQYQSENGTVFATWTLTVSTTNPSIEKPKKASEKTPQAKIEFVEED